MDDLEAGAWFVHKFGYLGSTVGLTWLARVARLVGPVGWPGWIADLFPEAFISQLQDVHAD